MRVFVVFVYNMKSVRLQYSRELRETLRETQHAVTSLLNNEQHFRRDYFRGLFPNVQNVIRRRLLEEHYHLDKEFKIPFETIETLDELEQLFNFLAHPPKPLILWEDWQDKELGRQHYEQIDSQVDAELKSIHLPFDKSEFMQRMWHPDVVSRRLVSGELSHDDNEW